MQENINNQPYQYQEESEIDIMELISKLWKNRKMIIKWCVVGAVIGLVIGFSIPKTYTAGVTLAPEVQQKTGSGVSSIASMMGVNLNNTLDAINAEMFPDVVHSTPFIVELFDLPVTFERKDSVITTTLLDYMKNYQHYPWWNYIILAPKRLVVWCYNLIEQDIEKGDNSGDDIISLHNLPKSDRNVVKYFVDKIQVNVDKKTLKTDMSLEMQDPQVVYLVMDAIVENLKKYMTEYRSSKSRQDVENLSVICELRKADYYKAQQAYANYIDSNKSVIRQSAQAERERLQQEMNLAYQVYSQVATQMEGARIQAEQAKPVFAIVHPPVIPLRQSAPVKSMILLITIFISGICAAAWVLFGIDLWNKIKQVLS